MCFARTFVKLDGFWTNLADCFLNKFFIKQCKQMSPKPSTSFVLSAETRKSPTANPPDVQPLSHGFSRCIKTRAFGYVLRRAWSQGRWCILPRCPLEAADVARYSAYVRGLLHIPARQRTCTPRTGHHRAATTWNPDFIGPDVWPANSPNLNPVDYRIWGLIQERVYQTAIRDINDLKQRLTCVWDELKKSVVDKAIEQWWPRLRAAFAQRDNTLNSC